MNQWIENLLANNRRQVLEYQLKNPILANKRIDLMKLFLGQLIKAKNELVIKRYKTVGDLRLARLK